MNIKTMILPVVVVDESGKPIHCKVRKIEINAETNKIICKYALSRDGEWILIPESTIYPEETILSVSSSLRHIPCSNGCGKMIYTSFDDNDGIPMIKMCSDCFDKTDAERWAEEQ